MKLETKDRLVTGFAQYHSAQAAGSSRFAIADAYLAVDNYFSAILLETGVNPPKNHKQKLGYILNNFGNLLKKAKVTKNELEKFYDCWQNVRYSSTTLTPNETLDFMRLSHHILHAIIEELAHQNGKSSDQLEDELYTEVLGGRWSSFDEECSRIHEMWQEEAEIKGEMDIGSKLGNKMIQPSNFCGISAFTDDDITKGIIAKDPEFGSKVANFYQSFLNLVVHVLNTRFERGVDLDEVTNFMLSLRLRYHGQNMKEIADDWNKIIAESIKSLKNKKLTEDQNSDDDSDV